MITEFMTNTEIRNQVSSQVWDQVSDQVWDQVCNQVWDQALTFCLQGLTKL